jgi:hypothetical protein
MLSPRDKDIAALAARLSLFLAWVPSACLFRHLHARDSIRAVSGLKRCRAGHATMLRENGFAQKQVKLLCEKAKAEMSDTQRSSRRGEPCHVASMIRGSDMSNRVFLLCVLLALPLPALAGDAASQWWADVPPLPMTEWKAADRLARL